MDWHPGPHETDEPYGLLRAVMDFRNIVWGQSRRYHPICDRCGQVRNDESYWMSIEGRVRSARLAQWCPNCCRTEDGTAED